jgi:DNA modification methylase
VTLAFHLADWINAPDDAEPRFIEGDCREVLAQFPDACADLIVTSPPYPRAQRKPADLGRYRRAETAFGGRRVTSHAQMEGTATPAKHTHGKLNIKGERGLVVQLKPAAWWSWFEPISAELLRVVKPHPYVCETILGMEGQGWSLCQEIIWRKPNGVPVNAEGCMQDVTEKVLWFAQGRGKPIWYPGEIADPTKRPVKRPIVRNVWAIPVGQTRYPPGQPHFAAYPMRLVEKIIRGWTQPGDLVLDPFMGSGTTLIAAHELGRRSIGIELNPEGELDCAWARWKLEFG